jgi:hypothetical protein
MFLVGEKKVICSSWLQYFCISLDALDRSSVALEPQLYSISVEIDEATSSIRVEQMHFCNSVSESPHMVEYVCMPTLYEIALETHGA